MNRAQTIAADLREYTAYLQARITRCGSDEERLLLWHEANNAFELLTVRLAGIARIIAETSINPVP